MASKCKSRFAKRAASAAILRELQPLKARCSPRFDGLLRCKRNGWTTWDKWNKRLTHSVVYVQKVSNSYLKRIASSEPVPWFTSSRNSRLALSSSCCFAQSSLSNKSSAVHTSSAVGVPSRQSCIGLLRPRKNQQIGEQTRTMIDMIGI